MKLSLEHRIKQITSAVMHGGLARVFSVLWERKTRGYSIRSLSYSWPKPMRLNRAARDTGVDFFMLPHLNSQASFAGIQSFLEIAKEQLESGRSVHFVCTDFPGAVSAFFDSFPALDSARYGPKIECSDFSLESEILLSVTQEDRFFCSAWWNKLSIDQATGEIMPSQSIHYVVQDFEPLFYSENEPIERELKSLARRSYTQGIHYHVNSESLQSFLLSEKVIDPDQVASLDCFSPKISPRFKAISGSKKSKKLFVYARPEVRRNRFDLIVDVLAQCGKALDSWEILGGGSLKENIDLPSGNKITALGKLPFDDYVELASQCAVAFSLMESPHPSHPPLEFFDAGAFVLSNAFKGKDLSMLGDRMACVKLDRDDLTKELLRLLSQAEKEWEL